MMQRGKSPIRQLVTILFLAVPTGCAPTVEILGVYFPSWLASTIAGIAASYGIVLWLAKKPMTQPLADSGFFFVLLVVIISLAVWWMGFSEF